MKFLRFSTLAIAAMMLLSGCTLINKIKDKFGDPGEYEDEAYDISDAIEDEDEIADLDWGNCDDEEETTIYSSDDYDDDTYYDTPQEYDAPAPSKSQRRSDSGYTNSRQQQQTQQQQSAPAARQQPAANPQVDALINSLASSVANLENLCARAQRGDSKAGVKQVVEYDNVRSQISAIRRHTLTPDQQARVRELESRANSAYY